ncbi:MAG: hypothetical protein WCP77_12270 [Roseococcus sp.]
MTALQDLLAHPIAESDIPANAPLCALLDELQANILKHHGRRHAAHLFLSFDGMAPAAVARVMRGLGRKVTSARSQLDHSLSQGPATDGGTVFCLFLSAGGYRALGPLARMPGNAAFAAGLESRRSELADPVRMAWGVGWTDAPPPDAMLLIADADPARVDQALNAVEDWLGPTGARILVIERGFQQQRHFAGNAAPLGVEHFGYVDGRSQPLFTREDIAQETPFQGWPAAFPLGQVVVPDPNGRTEFAAGSYFVFRKLEQDVRGFKAAEEALADALFGEHAPDDVRERAGALVVGRFENGTPALEAAPRDVPPPNDFDFADDAPGRRCPMHAHIRKTNPRADLPLEDARAAVMARRGITYGQRPMKPDGSDFAEADGKAPTGGVGLLFMAYMRDIAAQFERIQAGWANAPGFRRPGTGLDPVIGQGGGEAERSYDWPGGARQGFAQFVHMQGGEYFFAPSRGWLAGLR